MIKLADVSKTSEKASSQKSAKKEAERSGKKMTEGAVDLHKSNDLIRKLDSKGYKAHVNFQNFE